MDEEQPTIGALVAALCARLGEGDGPLVDDEDIRSLAAAAVAAVRGGTAEPALRALFEQLEAAMRRAGLAHGLGASGHRADPPVRYQGLPGLQGRAVHTVLRCPAADPCARRERVTWATRADPPVCAVHGGALQTVRRHG